jgi:Peroxiredoxin
MAQTPSTMLPLGTPAPAFTLPDVTNNGRLVSLTDYTGRRALLVMFICNHCPFVKHVRGELARLGRDYQAREVGIVAINPNDIVAYPDDAPDRMIAEAREAGYTFPYLFDQTQRVAQAYRAACTPDFFLFDGSMRLAYRGQLDDSRPSTKRGGNDLPLTGRDLRAAIDAILAGGMPSGEQRPSIGCNIKWCPGFEPEYYTQA